MSFEHGLVHGYLAHFVIFKNAYDTTTTGLPNKAGVKCVSFNHGGLAGDSSGLNLLIFLSKFLSIYMLKPQGLHFSKNDKNKKDIFNYL